MTISSIIKSFLFEVINNYSYLYNYNIFIFISIQLIRISFNISN